MNPKEMATPEKKQRGRPRKAALPAPGQPTEIQAKDINSMTAECIDSIRTALRQAEALARERHAQKLSNSRIGNVARELKEVLKVLTRYC